MAKDPIEAMDNLDRYSLERGLSSLARQMERAGTLNFAVIWRCGEPIVVVVSGDLDGCVRDGDTLTFREPAAPA